MTKQSHQLISTLNVGTRQAALSGLQNAIPVDFNENPHILFLLDSKRLKARILNRQNLLHLKLF
jgi:hypothetical protein